MTDNSKRTGAAIEAHYQFLVWLVPTIEKFPKAQKFTLGDRVQVTALDVLEALIEATYTRERAQQLRQANLGIEKLRFLLRLAADLRLLDRRRYEHAARALDETGRLIGGWMKAHNASRGDRRRLVSAEPADVELDAQNGTGTGSSLPLHHVAHAGADPHSARAEISAWRTRPSHHIGSTQRAAATATRGRSWCQEMTHASAVKVHEVLFCAISQRARRGPWGVSRQALSPSSKARPLKRH